MLGRDSCLHTERTRTCFQRLIDQRQSFGDLPVIPAGAILFLEYNQIAGFIEQGIASGIVKNMRATRPVASAVGSGTINILTRRPRRMASAQRSVRTSCWPRVAA